MRALELWPNHVLLSPPDFSNVASSLGFPQMDPLMFVLEYLGLFSAFDCVSVPCVFSLVQPPTSFVFSSPSLTPTTLIDDVFPPLLKRRGGEKAKPPPNEVINEPTVNVFPFFPFLVKKHFLGRGAI